jgi:hypothetical protein
MARTQRSEKHTITRGLIVGDLQPGQKRQSAISLASRCSSSRLPEKSSHYPISLTAGSCKGHDHSTLFRVLLEGQPMSKVERMFADNKYHLLKSVQSVVDAARRRVCYLPNSCVNLDRVEYKRLPAARSLGNPSRNSRGIRLPHARGYSPTVSNLDRIDVRGDRRINNSC